MASYLSSSSIARSSRQTLRLCADGLACRHASTSTNPYPWPLHSQPTPHQIFHLPGSATENDIKQRYYDLVRIYHPDSPASRSVPPDTAQARFHSISAAYDVLRGKSTTLARENAEVRRKYNRRAEIWRSRPELDPTLDDRWKDRAIVAFVVFGVFAFVAQTAMARSKAMANNVKKSRLVEPQKTYPGDSALGETGEPT